MTEKESLIALYSFIYFGPTRTKLLIQYFGGAKNAWGANRQELLEIGLGERLVEEFLDYKKNFKPRDYFSKLKSLSINVTTLDDDNFPENLREIEDAPLVLYVRGKIIKADVNAIGIVGSRKMTSYGREVTQKFSSELASIGITIVSGLAFGVDLTAHKSALEVGGRCIAVIAGGVDKITPRSNEWLGEKIVASGGAVISEFPPNVEPQRHFFPFRNRIISGLSKGVVVVEGMIKSGTLHTANHAAKQGRSVFAIPGQITSPTSAAPHYLIKNGAKLVTCVGDILEDLELETKVDIEQVEKLMPKDDIEAKLLEILGSEPLHLDEVSRIAGLKVSDVSVKLIFMELKGLVRNLGGGIYKKI